MNNLDHKKKYDYWKQSMDEIWMEQMRIIHKGKDIEQAALEAYGYLICDDLRLANAETSDFKRLVNGWLSNKRFPAQQKINRLDLKNI
jgi:hypothetical protein